MQQPQPNTNMLTTEQIQAYLDENKTLILAILDNQNLGKLPECAQYQAKLQRNLMYLAAIADAQPQTPPMPSQMPPQVGMNYMQQQHPQSGFPPKSPMQFSPQQMQEHQMLQLQHQQALQGHMGMRPGVNNGLQGMHHEANLGGGGGASGSLDAREKQDGGEAGSENANGELSNKKGSEDGK